MRTWDYLEKQCVDSDTTRWTCEWATDPGGILDDPDGDLADLMYEYASYGEGGKGLAIARGKKVLREGTAVMGCVQVYREAFEMATRDTGCFERVDDTMIELTHDDL